MSIYRDKKTGCFLFRFNRRICGKHVRARRILPKEWTQAQADAFDRQESARLYAIATGIEQLDHTIEQAVACYFKHRCPQLKGGTAAIQEILTTFWAYKGVRLRELPEVCNQIARTWQGQLSPATIRNRIRYLSAACRYAYRNHGMGERDPAERLVVPTVNNERRTFVTRGEMLAIASRCDNRAVRAIIRIAFYSGMRRSEILRALPRGSAFTLADTKNGHPRHVPIHPKIAVCQKYYPLAISPSTVVKHWVRARDRSGMTHLHFHDLRHSAASELVNAGVDLYTVGQILGHRDPRSTQRYAHLSVHAMKIAVGKIGSQQR